MLTISGITALKNGDYKNEFEKDRNCVMFHNTHECDMNVPCIHIKTPPEFSARQYGEDSLFYSCLEHESIHHALHKLGFSKQLFYFSWFQMDVNNTLDNIAGAITSHRKLFGWSWYSRGGTYFHKGYIHGGKGGDF